MVVCMNVCISIIYLLVYYIVYMYVCTLHLCMDIVCMYVCMYACMYVCRTKTLLCCFLYRVDEILYSETTNISGVSKFLLVKMSVGAIVLLG